MKERFKFNTVGLFTRDNKATVDFYTKTFGFTTDWDGIQPNVEMTLGNMRQHALTNGAASVLSPTTEPWGQRTCYVADPDGNLIEIGTFTK